VTRASTRRYARVALAYAAVAGALLLWPYRFSWPAEPAANGVRWLEGGGIEFAAPGVIRSGSGSRPVLAAMAAGQGFGVDAWVISNADAQSGPARILGSSQDVDHRNFMLGQEHDQLALRLRTDRTNANGTPGLRIPKVFSRGSLRHLLVAYDGAVLRVWVDGALAAESHEPGGTLDVWDPGNPLLLGNETNGTRPWLGRILRIALYARPLDDADATSAFAAGARAGVPQDRAADRLVALYRFDAGSGALIADDSGRAPGAALEIPAGFRIGERKLLAFRDRGRPFDRIVNALAFIPFGFVLERALSGSRRRSLLALASILAFALGIESAQYFLEDRTSSAVDAALNVLGAALGIAFARSPRAGRLGL
jgi:hypothetical protein